MKEIRKILVGVDGSENSLRAAEMAADLAIKYGAQVSMVFVIGGQDYTMLEGKEVWADKASRIGEMELKKAVVVMDNAGVKYSTDVDRCEIFHRCRFRPPGKEVVGEGQGI